MAIDPVYPAEVPNFVEEPDSLLGLPDGIPQADFERFVVNTQALFDTAGPNPQGDKGTIGERLDDHETRLGVLGNFGFRNLVVTNGATPATQVRVAFDELAVEGSVVRGFDETASLLSSGALGLLHGTRAPATAYYPWVGVNPINGAATVALAPTPLRDSLDTSHVSVSGIFTRWKRVGGLVTIAGGSGDFPGFQQTGDWVWIDAADDTATHYTDFANSDALFRDVALKLIPPTARMASVSVFLAAVAQYEAIFNTAVLRVRRNGASGTGAAVASTNNAAGGFGAAGGQFLVPIDAAATFEAQWSVAGGSNAARFTPRGYRDDGIK